MAIYEKATLGFADNQIAFNDYSLNPIFRAIARVPQKFQIRQDDQPIPFESGISDFITSIGESVYVIQGVMYPADEGSYDIGLANLRSVCSLDLDQSDSFAGAAFSNDGYVPYSWGDASGDFTKQLFVKPLYVQLAESTRQGYVVPFTIYCKIKDPIIYGGSLKTASTAQANPSQSVGTFVLPTTLPAPIGITTYTTSASASNIGTIATYPEAITVYGPVTNPTISNSANGKQITINITLSSGSDVLSIQYGKDIYSITKNGVNVAQFLSSTSQLFKIQPGTNTFTLSGSLSTGAYATVNFYDGWALS